MWAIPSFNHRYAHSQTHRSQETKGQVMALQICPSHNYVIWRISATSNSHPPSHGAEGGGNKQALEPFPRVRKSQLKFANCDFLWCIHIYVLYGKLLEILLKLVTCIFAIKLNKDCLNIYGPFFSFQISQPQIFALDIAVISRHPTTSGRREVRPISDLKSHLVNARASEEPVCRAPVGPPIPRPHTLHVPSDGASGGFLCAIADKSKTPKSYLPADATANGIQRTEQLRVPCGKVHFFSVSTELIAAKKIVLTR